MGRIFTRIEFMHIGYTLSTFIVFAYLSDVWLLYFDFRYLFTYDPKDWYTQLITAWVALTILTGSPHNYLFTLFRICQSCSKLSNTISDFASRTALQIKHSSVYWFYFLFVNPDSLLWEFRLNFQRLVRGFYAVYLSRATFSFSVYSFSVSSASFLMLV